MRAYGECGAVLALSAVLLTATGCGDTFLIQPSMVEDESTECPLVHKTLEVFRFANTYLTNELEIARDPNRGAWTCTLVYVREEWHPLGGFLVLFTRETWECEKCDPLWVPPSR